MINPFKETTLFLHTKNSKRIFASKLYQIKTDQKIKETCFFFPLQFFLNNYYVQQLLLSIIVEHFLFFSYYNSLFGFHELVRIVLLTCTIINGQHWKASAEQYEIEFLLSKESSEEFKESTNRPIICLNLFSNGFLRQKKKLLQILRGRGDNCAKPPANAQNYQTNLASRGKKLNSFWFNCERSLGDRKHS